jgi:hypothetical protein
LFGISWREPVNILDATTTSLSNAITALNATNTIQGQTVTQGFKILYNDLTSENNNIYHSND